MKIKDLITKLFTKLLYVVQYRKLKSMEFAIREIYFKTKLEGHEKNNVRLFCFIRNGHLFLSKFNLK